MLAIIILATCCKNLKSLSFIQRIGIVSLSLGILIPASFDFINGFISGLSTAANIL
ncbi:hypothetical protein [Paraclostridium sordellii]|uniref:hypothetical protein n=1 Tax=Paraclostridium sordellii TaxID=1505 RepID=UPI0018CFB15C|nr:hypothetical protein [Paeniclostridium sordellii]